MTIAEIKQLLADSKSDDVIAAVDQIVSGGGDRALLAQAYYLRGNAYRQQGDMRQAMMYMGGFGITPHLN